MILREGPRGYRRDQFTDAFSRYLKPKTDAPTANDLSGLTAEISNRPNHHDSSHRHAAMSNGATASLSFPT